MLGILLVTGIFFLYDFSGEVVSPGQIMVRYFDTYPGVLTLNLYLTKCEGQCEIELSAFEEVRRKQIFSNITGYKAVCCGEGLPCSGNGLFFADLAPVIKRPIVMKQEEGDIILGHSSTLDQREIILKQSNEVDLPRKGLWTIMISNCGSSPVSIDGNASIRRKDGYLDSRLQSFSVLASIQVVLSIVVFGYFLYNWMKNLPKLTPDHNRLVGAFIFVIMEGTVSVLFFVRWNRNGIVGIPLLVIYTSIRSITHAVILYLTLHQLQRPREIPFYIFILIVLPLAIGSHIELDSIAHFAKRESGKWLFGFSKTPSFEFFATSIALIGIAYYSATNKPTESVQNDRRKQFLGIVAGSFVAYFFMSISLLIWRRSKTLIETRKSEWVPFSIPNILFFVLLCSNSWYINDINPEGWQTLDSAPQEEPTYNRRHRNFVETKLNNGDNEIPALPSSSSESDDAPKND